MLNNPPLLNPSHQGREVEMIHSISEINDIGVEVAMIELVFVA